MAPPSVRLSVGRRRPTLRRVVTAPAGKEKANVGGGDGEDVEPPSESPSAEKQRVKNANRAKTTRLEKAAALREELEGVRGGSPAPRRALWR